MTKLDALLAEELAQWEDIVMEMDMEHRYAPKTVIVHMRNCQVTVYYVHPPCTHTSPIVPTMTALECVTQYGSRWYGIQRGYINAELRMVVVGTDPRDEVRMTWDIVPKDLQDGR